MELDYIENVNDLEENVVRLYNFDKAEAIKFRDLIKDIIIDKKKKLDLSEVDFITPRNCNWSKLVGSPLRKFFLNLGNC